MLLGEIENCFNFRLKSIENVNCKVEMEKREYFKMVLHVMPLGDKKF